MKLTDAYLKALKTPDKAKTHPDGRGLVLLHKPNGIMAWRYRYRFAGKANMLSLGNYPNVSLKAAREAHSELRKLLESGIDPSLVRQEKKLKQGEAAENSFQAVALRWYENWKDDKAIRHVATVLRRMQADLFPPMGKRPINEIKASYLIMVIKRIESRGALDIAKRAWETSRQIFRYAVAHGICEHNPTGDIKPADFLKTRTKKNYARIEGKDLPKLLRDIAGYSDGRGSEITMMAMQLMAYVFVRTGELIGARWSEIDLDAKEWRIPPERMKMKDPHIVLLSDQTLAIFKRLHEISGGREFVFPSASNPKKSMSNNTILKALERMGYKSVMTGHGFRGVASTILHEQGYTHEHIELQLAHAPRNAVSASYNHALYLPQRRVMLQDWANYLDAIKIGADVIPLNVKAGNRRI